jgi:beta-galactosidase
LRHLYRYYRAGFANQINVEVVAPDAAWDGYRVVLAPSLTLLDAGGAARLRAYVQGGGTLVLTVQSAVRNPDNALWQQALPAWLTELCGLEIEEQHALPGADTVGVVPAGAADDAVRQEFSQVFDLVRTTTAKALFCYADRWFAGTPAVTVNEFGVGKVYYVAGVATVDFLTDLVARIAEQAGVRRNVVSVSSPWVETVRLTASGRELLYVINHTREAQTVEVAGAPVNLLTGEAVAGQLELGPLAAACLERH